MNNDRLDPVAVNMSSELLFLIYSSSLLKRDQLNYLLPSFRYFADFWGGCSDFPEILVRTDRRLVNRRKSSLSSVGGILHRRGTYVGSPACRLVFKAHRLLYHSTLGLRVIKKKRRTLR